MASTSQQPVSAFMNNLYQTYTGRAPDAGGAAYWQNALDNGMSQADLTTSFKNEVVKRVNAGDTGVSKEIYEQIRGERPQGPLPDNKTYLGPDGQVLNIADPGLLDSNNGAYTGGTAATSTALTDPNKTQRSAFMDNLYQTYTGRTPDAEGAAYWQSQLDSGMSEAELTAAFKNEVVNRVNSGNYNPGDVSADIVNRITQNAGTGTGTGTDTGNGFGNDYGTGFGQGQLPIPDPTIAEGGSFAEPFFKTAYQEAFNQYNQGGPQYYGGAQVAGFSPQQLEAQRQAQGTNQQLNLLGQFQTGATARQLGQDIREIGIPGQVRAPTQVQQINSQGIDPRLARAVSRPLTQQLNENILPGISSGATQAGAFGGSRQGILENQARSRTAGAVTDALARATQQQQQIGLNQRGQDINQGQFSGTFLAGQRQQDINTALQQRGQNLGALQSGQSGASAARQGLLAGPGVLSGVGAQQQQMQQQLINANMQRYNYGQNAPQQNLAKLFGFLGGRPTQASSPNTTPASGFSSGLADATDAYNLYNLVTG